MAPDPPRTARSLCLTLLAIGALAVLRAADGDPRDQLPPHITRLTWFGERADWRHDGRRFVFLSKTFGDAYEYDFATGRIIPVTDHFTHFGFVRVLYLSNGDLLLSGPKANFDRTSKADRERARDSSYLYVLDKSLTKPPVPLGVQCNEGPAVSRTRLRIAWTHGEQDHISTGEIEYENGLPRLVNPQVVLRTSDFPPGERPRKWIETQNFTGWKGAEGAISDDGKYMLFQDGRGGMEAGQGFSIYLYDFGKVRPGR